MTSDGYIMKGLSVFAQLPLQQCNLTYLEQEKKHSQPDICHLQSFARPDHALNTNQNRRKFMKSTHFKSC